MSPQFTHDDLVKAAPRVLDRLRSMATLPDHGTVAGQSVASVFFEELNHPVRGPINDIDVFVNVSMPRPMRGLEDLPPGHQYPNVGRILPTTSRPGDISVENDTYRHIKFIAQRTEIDILRTYQVGLVNYTLIHSSLSAYGSHGHDARVSKGIVSGFDINAVGVGINLTTGEVVSSPGFLEFLNTSKLKVETCNTPAHTLIRLAKKFHGNELPGARCDYEVERALLEASIHCQQRTESGEASPVHAVLRFGSGKFKALYERFSEHLPSLLAKGETLPDGRYYVFNRLVPPPLENEYDKWLAQGVAGAGALPQCVAQTIYTSHFPQIYDLFHPERCTLDHDATQERRKALVSMDPRKSDGFNLTCLQKALGRPAVMLDVPGMDEDEAAAFFFNQECAKSTERARQAVEAMACVSEIELRVLIRLRQRADRALMMHMDRENTWKSLLLEKGADVASAVLECPDVDQDGLGNRIQILELLDWVDQMGEEGLRFYHGLLPVAHAEADASPHLFLNLVLDFPSEEREQVASRIMRKVVPSWPAMKDQPPGIAISAIISWAMASQSPDPACFKSLPSDVIERCLNAACERFQYKYGTQEIPTAQLDDLFEHLLPRLDSKSWQNNDGLLIRAMLSVGAAGQLEARLRQIEDPALTHCLQRVAAAVHKNTTSREPLPWEEDGKKQWHYIPRPEVALAALEGMILSRSHQVQAPSPPGRRSRL